LAPERGVKAVAVQKEIEMPEQDTTPAKFSISRFLFQVIVVPPMMILLGGFTWGIGFEFGMLATGAKGLSAAANALGYTLCGLTGFGLGRLVKHWLPRVTQSGGSIVGVAPTLTLIFALLNEFRRGNYRIDSYFIARTGMGVEGWAIIFLTIPAVGCCFYSLAAALPTRFWRGRVAR
jgi:hypothetical protein